MSTESKRFTRRPISAIINIIVNRMGRYRWAGLFPELELFEDATAAQAALHRAKNAVLRNVRRWLALMCFIIAVGVVIGLLFVWLRRAVGIDPSWTGGASGGVSGATGVIAVQYLFRRPIQQQLRTQLNQQGRPVCMKCGYNLRGNVSNRCPECGTPTHGGTE